MKTEVISSDPEILGGTLVFNDIRVPIQVLFDHLYSGLTTEDFMKSFPTVSREQVDELLRQNK